MPEPVLQIVLDQPEIPFNAGNVGRTCVAIGAKLWLVRPLGFLVDDRHVRRAGLDYWDTSIGKWSTTGRACLPAARPDLLVSDENRPAALHRGPDPARRRAGFWQRIERLAEPMRQEHPEQCLRIPMHAKFAA